MNEFDDLTSRLEALGTNPVPPPVATQHLTAIAEVGERSGRLSHKIRVAAAFGVGILVGGTGLGYAAAESGVLPEPAHEVAVEALGKVGLDVDEPDEATKAEKAKSANGGQEGGDSAKPASLQVLDANCGESRGEFVSRNVKLNREAGNKGGASEIAKAAKECFPSPDETEDADHEDGAEATAKDGENNGNRPKERKGEKPETPAGPPSEQQGNAPADPPPAQVPVAPQADDDAERPEDKPPVDTPNNGESNKPSGATED